MKKETSLLLSLLSLACASPTSAPGDQALQENPVVVTIAVGGVT